MKKNIIFMIFLSFIFFIAMVEVSADSPAEQTPYQIELENGNKIFYMYPCYANDENGVPDDSWLKSGLYYTTDPIENIYLINSPYAPNYSRIYFYQWELIFSDDGVYFANMPWTTSYTTSYPYDGLAIGFHENGILMKKYYVADLVEDETKLEYSVSHVTWEKQKERKFDEVNNILSITTNDNIIYKFDLITGNIIDKKNIELPNNILNPIIISIIIICILILLFFLIKNKLKKNRRIV